MKTKQQRIDAELKRMNSYFNELQEDRKAMISGLLVSAANSRIFIEELEQDIIDNGFVEEFTQSDKVAPYQRQRASSKIYTIYLKQYQSIIKQLVDLLPDHQQKSAHDEIMEFINS